MQLIGMQQQSRFRDH